MHTPGPWRAIGKEVFEHDTYDIIARPGHNFSAINPSQTLEANARLIAAAPRLLEALEALMKNMDAMNGDFSHLAWPCHCDLPECPDTMARAAIAEAKGE